MNFDMMATPSATALTAASETPVLTNTGESASGDRGVRLSSRTADLTSSPIRDILAVIDRPGMISFAGGLPAPETFPAIDTRELPAGWLQYGPSEGEPALRARIARELANLGLACDAAQVLILSGSQQGIDLVAKLFIDPGTRVAVESPTYLAALQVFRYFGAQPVTLTPQAPAFDAKPAFAYVIPTFQNPTGRCYTEQERLALAAACDSADIPLFEDDPYRDLVYDACDRQPVCARLKRASWVYQGSFSKSFAPGLRLGFLAATPDLLPYLVRLKQAADLHSNRISQWLALRQLNDPSRPARLRDLAAVYRDKRDAFELALRRHFCDLARWQRPPGGLFYWLQLNRAIDTGVLLAAALERNVAFMPGEPFFADPARRYPALRLNFSHAAPHDAERGLSILSALIRELSV